MIFFIPLVDEPMNRVSQGSHAIETSTSDGSSAWTGEEQVSSGFIQEAAFKDIESVYSDRAFG